MITQEDTVTLALETLGCKLNQAESEHLALELARAGYRLAPPVDGADIYVLNTCTVTHIADRKCRHLLRLARRRNPDALIIAVGCYADRAPEELMGVSGVDMVIGNGGKADLVHTLKQRAPAAAAGESPLSRTRSMVKIQQGCNRFCAYCIVPLVRGRERSVPLADVVAEVKAREAMGYREVVLTGTRIGAYGDGIEPLTRRILAESDVERIRLSSLEPRDLTPGLISLWGSGRLCRHLHLALQSGSDSVLRRMRRPYSTADYERAVAMVRGAIPDIAVTTDIMVGFPGETEDEFQESYRFCQRMEYANIHVFPFSLRPGTVAEAMPGRVEERVKKWRSERMLSLAREAAHRFRERFLGRRATVLWEREVEPGVWVGLTDNYIRVFATSDQDLRNRLAEVRLSGWHDRDLFALAL